MVDQEEPCFVLGLDIGTTTMTCCIYDQSCRIISSETARQILLTPKQGYFEIDPDVMWNSILQMCRETIKKANIDPNRISSMGISVLRNSFITWNPSDGKMYHNIITWKDLRASHLCHQYNSSFKLKFLRFFTKILYYFTRSTRYLRASAFECLNEMAVSRLSWALKEIPGLMDAANRGSAIFGTVDTWLIWKLTNGSIHATDPTNACVTGMYDSFVLDWNPTLLYLFDVPKRMLPKVLETNGFFGLAQPDLFGSAIPIRAVVGDQQSATFGENCFHLGDTKCTIGTGMFFNVNTHERIYPPCRNLYPVVGWKLTGEQRPTYLLETSSADCGSLINWADSIGLFDKPENSAKMAYEVPDSGGVFFLPPLSNLATSVNHSLSTFSYIGLRPTTTKSHLVRALLESISFQVKRLVDQVESSAKIRLNSICLNGGIAKNDFVLKLIADLCGRKVLRASNVEMSTLGAALLAGLSSGLFKDLDSLKEMKIVDKCFEPSGDSLKSIDHYILWKNELEKRIKNVS
ncbi:glycerol kinase 5-like [Brevipalpus obovatus]|uniref:glycerol kinase 5-like n=1 Tax=Brevipalpus obovatus TaxID=246614 RepID=UPI003D9F72D5